MTADPAELEAALQVHLRERLAPYKGPGEIVDHPLLPLPASGTIDKTPLRGPHG